MKTHPAAHIVFAFTFVVTSCLSCSDTTPDAPRALTSTGQSIELADAGCDANCATPPTDSLIALSLIDNSGGWRRIDKANDGTLGKNAHTGNTAGGATLTYDLGGQHTLTRARISEDNSGNWNVETWQLQYWTGSDWADAFPLTDTPTPGWNEVDFADVTTTQVRFVLNDPHVEVAEVEVYGFPQPCGDGDIDPGEACDDGNLTSGDGCDASCQFERPNIVFILVDDMGWSDIGAYGSEIDTPNLDTLATDGIRFTSFYQTGKCSPTRAALLTGTYAQQSNLHKTHNKNLQHAATLGEVLRAAGYRTLMSGKHHGKDNPYDRGFDRAYGLLDGASNHFNPGLQREGEPLPAQKKERQWMDDGVTFMTHDPTKQHYFPADFYSTDEFTDRALQYFDEYADEQQPFFLYLSYTAPHDPLHAPAESVAKYSGVYDVGYEAIRTARYNEQVATGLIDPARFPLSAATHGDNPPSADQIERMETYAGMIDRVDWNVGRVIDKLKAQGKFHNTLFLFASDNGASAENTAIGSGPINSVGRYASQQSKWANVSNTPFRHFKNYSYNGGVASPLIAHWTNGIGDPGRVDHYPLHLVDVMATFVELGEADYPQVMLGQDVRPMQGISFAPLLRTGELSPAARPPTFFEWKKGAAVREHQWKLVKHGDQAWNLYNMLSDTSETNNLADAFPAEVERLSTMFSAWQLWSAVEPTADQLPPVTADDSLSLAVGATATIDVLSNDGPNEQLDPTRVSIRVAPRWGNASVDVTTGAVTYEHLGDTAVSDSLQYVVYGLNGAPSHRATVEISVQ